MTPFKPFPTAMPTLPESPSPDTNKKAADASPSQGWRGWVRGHRAWLLLTLGLMLAVNPAPLHAFLARPELRGAPSAG